MGRWFLRLAHALRAPEEGPEGLGQRLGLQVLGRPLAVDHGLPVLKGPAEDGLQAHPPVRGEGGGFQLVQVEVPEVGGEAPSPSSRGPSGPRRLGLSSTGPSQAKTPTGNPVGVISPKRAVGADSIALSAF